MGSNLFTEEMEYHTSDTVKWQKRKQLEAFTQRLNANKQEVKALQKKQAEFAKKNRTLDAQDTKRLAKAIENVNNLKFTIAGLEEFLGIKR